jgi:signal transduction histidine kinase
LVKPRARLVRHSPLTAPWVTRVAALAAALGATLAVLATSATLWAWLAAGLGLVAGAGLGWWVARWASTTARRRAEGVQQVLAALPVAVLLFDDEGLAYANPEARRVVELDAAAASSPPHVDAPAVADAVNRARRTGQAIDGELERDGRQWQVSASPTACGQVGVVITDLTEVRRTDAIRRDFVLNASHELKTPVASIQALADSLRLATERDPARAASMLESLEREAARMSQLVRDLLDLVRLEERTGEEEPAEADLAELVRTQTTRVAQAAAEQGMDLRVDVPDVARVAGSPGDVRIVVANLVDNAVAYNRHGGTVTARVTRAGDDVVLEVSDTGIGISPEDQQRVFERFYRVDPHRSRRAGGTGLGLALVRHAVRRLSGELQLDSTLGQGTTLTVRLPPAPTSVAAPAQPPRP